MRKQKNFKPRTPNRFREREFGRVARVAKKLGGRAEIDPQTGRYSVIFDKPGEAKDSNNEVESWIEKQKGQHAHQR